LAQFGQSVIRSHDPAQNGVLDIIGAHIVMWIEKTARRIAQSTGLARTIRKIRPAGSRENERGFQWARQCKFEWSSVAQAEPRRPNPLQQFFERRKEGPGIFKWNHYFDIYQRHFEKFRGDAVHILEIGVYSGGSLEMWRDYFGPESRVYARRTVPHESAARPYLKRLGGIRADAANAEQRAG
jgi:hypothetical protein